MRAGERCVASGACVRAGYRSSAHPVRECLPAKPRSCTTLCKPVAWLQQCQPPRSNRARIARPPPPPPAQLDGFTHRGATARTNVREKYDYANVSWNIHVRHYRERGAERFFVHCVASVRAWIIAMLTCWYVDEPGQREIVFRFGVCAVVRVQLVWPAGVVGMQKEL